MDEDSLSPGVNQALDSYVIGNALNNHHLLLKESLLILKMKPSLNVAKELIQLYIPLTL